MVAGSCFSPSALTIPGTASINGPATVQANQTPSLTSKNLIQAGTTPLGIVIVDSSNQTWLQGGDSGQSAQVGIKAATAGHYFGINGSQALQTDSKFTLYNGAATAGNGLAAEIAAVATGSPVTLATSSTTVLTYTSSLTTGTYLVSVNAMSTAAAQVATFTVAYEDNSFSVAATATLTSPTLGSGAAYGDTIEINAKTGTAITVSGSCTTANDVKATAHIFGPL